MPACLSFHLFICPSVLHLSVCPSIYLCLSVFVYLSVCLSVSLSVLPTHLYQTLLLACVCLCSLHSSIICTSSRPVQAWTAYCHITSDGLVLSPHLLSRLLELCSEQTSPHPSPYLRLPELAHELMERIAAVQGSCSSSNYCSLMRVLSTCNKPTE